MDYEEKLSRINDCLDLQRDQIDYEQVAEQVRSLMNEVPEIKLRFEPKAQCFGSCLELNKMHNPKDLVKIPSDSHSYCVNCLSTWVTSSFFSNPYFPIYCQRCYVNSIYAPIPDSLYLNSIIPLNVNESYKTYYNNLNFNCTSCQNPFQFKSLFKFYCGHYFCSNDITNNVINQYMQVLKGNTQIAKDVIEFEIYCICDNSVINDSESLQTFNNLARNLYPYSKLSGFYLKHQNFFLNKSKLIKFSCCNKFKEIQDNEKNDLNCFNCYKCVKCNNAIHTGFSCEEFNEISSDYLISGDCYDLKSEFNKMHSGVREYIKDICGVDAKFEKIVNKKLDILFRFRKVWEFGYVALDRADDWQGQVKEKFEKGIEIFKSIETDFKLIAICEIHGSRVERHKTAEEELNDNVIYDLGDRFKIKSEKQIRFLYLIGRS